MRISLLRKTVGLRSDTLVTAFAVSFVPALLPAFFLVDPMFSLTSSFAAEVQPVTGISSESPRASATPDTATALDTAITPGTAADLADWINARFRHLWSEQKVTPEFCDDLTYLRRVSLDLIGRIPGIAEIREFEADSRPDKRARLVQRLLSDPDDPARLSPLAAEHFARVWRRVLLPPGSTGIASAPQLESWLRDQLAQNVRYDQMVRKLVVARGEESRQEQVFYQAIGATPEAEATEFSRIFLGVRIGCAQCHDHPFAAWRQRDFWGMAAFFSGLRFEGSQMAGNPSMNARFLNDDGASGMLEHKGKTYTAKVLWKDEPVVIPKDRRPRDLLADWMTSPEHPTFAANAVNRVWQALLGRGLVIAADDLDLETEEGRALVEEAGRRFAAGGFDLRELISSICRSEPYQCVTSATGEETVDLEFGARPLKSMGPEELFASLEQALLLPVSRSSEDAARHNGEMQELVRRLSETSGRTPEEYAAGVPQTLLMMNGPLLSRATDLERSHTLRGVVEAPFLTDKERIETLYLATLSRRPAPAESQRLLAYVQSRPTLEEQCQAYADILWALVNGPEFVLCQ